MKLRITEVENAFFDVLMKYYFTTGESIVCFVFILLRSIYFVLFQNSLDDEGTIPLLFVWFTTQVVNSSVKHIFPRMVFILFRAFVALAAWST